MPSWEGRVDPNLHVMSVTTVEELHEKGDHALGGRGGGPVMADYGARHTLILPKIYTPYTLAFHACNLWPTSHGGFRISESSNGEMLEKEDDASEPFGLSLILWAEVYDYVGC